MTKKYIDAELLRKEIEFAKTVYEHPNRVVHGVADAFRQDGRAAMCDDILKKIDSLQQEQPEADLEEEMDRFFEEMSIQEHENIFEDTYQMIARHFYELGLKSK